MNRVFCAIAFVIVGTAAAWTEPLADDRRHEVAAASSTDSLAVRDAVMAFIKALVLVMTIVMASSGNTTTLLPTLSDM